MQFVDTHAHLFTEEFDGDRNEVINRALEQQISKIVLPNIDTTSIAAIRKTADEFTGVCFPAMGLHPCSVNADYISDLKAIENELYSFKDLYVAVGEMGMDLYWDKTFIKEQEDAFNIQCSWAFELRIPVIIHSREATDELILLLEKMQNRPGGIFHCFTGTTGQAERIVNMGMSLGIGGVVTYKKSDLPDVLKNIPLQHIVLETDAPYLPPVPYRGKRNETSYMIKTAEKIAEIYGVDLQVVADITTKNALDLFRI